MARLASLTALVLAATPLAAQDAATPRRVDGQLPGDARWEALVPANFNGTLLWLSAALHKNFASSAGYPG